MMVGDSIRKLRQERNLTQEQLAEAIGVSPTAIKQYEDNIWRPGNPILARMAILWGIAIQDLVDWELGDKRT